jgi:hypothetical protein
MHVPSSPIVQGGCVVVGGGEVVGVGAGVGRGADTGAGVGTNAGAGPGTAAEAGEAGDADDADDADVALLPPLLPTGPCEGATPPTGRAAVVAARSRGESVTDATGSAFEPGPCGGPLA